MTTRSTTIVVGGGLIEETHFKHALEQGWPVIAADGGADAVLAAGHVPDLVIGDLDSISQAAKSRIPAGRIQHISEQESTDFDKALRHIEAPLIEAHGFWGKRMDHGLAALNVLQRYAEKRCLLLAESDVIMLCPPDLHLELPQTCRVSLFPLRPVTGRSTGLKWPIKGINFAPGGVIGTSNEALGPVHLCMDGPDMLLILPLEALDALREGLKNAPGW